MKMYFILSVLMTTLGLACSRDTSKVFRSMPAISNSLVNLGKMDITIHFNGKDTYDEGQFNQKQQLTHSASPFFFQKPEPVQQTVDIERFEPCPCSSVKNFKNPFVGNSPQDMLAKILKSNDLFSFNQETVVSTTCCDSHEHVHEDNMYVDLAPMKHVKSPLQSQVSTFMLDTIIPKVQAPSFTPASSFKPKAIEILFFPKNKDSFLDFSKLLPMPPRDKKTKTDIRSGIKIVGDKELNEFKTLKYRPSIPITPTRDANLTLEKKEIEQSKGIKTENMAENKDNDFKGKINGISMKTTPPPFTPTTDQ